MKIQTSILLLMLTHLLLAASACVDDDPLTLSDEELAERIRANTPTELPPVTTSGENTMGAWIHPQPGSPLHTLVGDSLLFVASGVDRPETALATSLDCKAFDNYLFQSNSYVSANGDYCRRPEIGDDRHMSIIFGYIAPDSVQIYFNYHHSNTSSILNYRLKDARQLVLEYDILIDNRDQQIFSGTFQSGLINRSPPYDTLQITDGRFDVTYGITP